jgi:hypothetical protein
MVEITILELNLNAEDLIANAPFSSGEWGKGDADDADTAGGDEGFLPAFDDDDDGGAAGDGPNLKPVAIGVGLLVLVLLVVGARRLVGGEPEPLP